VPETTAPRGKARFLKGWLRPLLGWLLVALGLLWSLAALTLVMARWIDPPTTAVHMERRLQSWFHGKPYRKRYEFVPLGRISLDLQHAVIAAEDGRFYEHHGFDWRAIEVAAENDLEGRRIHGGSTLTQQLIKNLFFGTGRSILRKGAEATLVPVAEVALGKRRILELYLNVVEWGPGVYGAESACRTYYRTSARNADRQESAQLAAILPQPLRRRPDHMSRYSALIEERMRQLGW